MRSQRSCLTSMIGMLILAASLAWAPGAQAQPSIALLGSLPGVGDYFSVGYYYHQLLGLFSSYNTCRANHYSDSLCTEAFRLCAINDLPTGGVAGAFFTTFQTLSAFKVDCGDGQCFACCHQPSAIGCHTSFPSPNDDGEPVINCNPYYYEPGTRQVGMTLVLNGQPGQACLFTQQICDHLALCNNSAPPAQIAATNADPQNVMKSAAAVNNRAQAFATQALGDWSDILSGFSTSTSVPAAPAQMPQKVHTLASLGTFITGRGCTGWLANIPSSFPNDWSEAQFRINDSSGNYADEPSHYNGLRQLGLVRFLASVPNLWKRLEFVESTIWTPGAINQYLGSVDADATLLRSMSPMALEILKRNKTLQDYRLLALPVPGETVTPQQFDGCQLASPPAVTLSYRTRSTFGVDLQVQAADSATNSSLGVDGLVLWGDGSVTPVTVSPGNLPQVVSHDYATGGKYQIFVLVQNQAGLKTAGALVATTAGTGANPGASPSAGVSEIQLVDLQGQVVSLTGGPAYMMFEVQTWPTTTQGYTAGISPALTMPLNTAVSFGTVGAWNADAATLQSVAIVPSWWGDGWLVGFNSIYFTLDRLRIGVYSTQDKALRYTEIPVTPDIVRLYPHGTTTPVPLTQPTYASNGRLEIPVQVGSTLYDRVDLVFPSSILSQAVQGPVTTTTWSGITGTFVEQSPEDVHTIPPSATDFYTLAPCRLIDTRATDGPRSGPALRGGSYRAFASANFCGVPADAKALATNVTVIEGSTAGFLRIFPGTGPVALPSAINYSAGQVRANNAIISLSQDGTGTFSVYADTPGNVNLVVDVYGYFK